ncbi:agamous-like MADS-box protein AGL80-like [Hibiscus syriacus]|uniref:Protein-serine/threonine kinase n=1 Tax=Hibiscus syriacus TaxID=106335 RepID=A0A6A3AEE6_HIBSY|nr:agamous-like MADS-box protein AGL80-like [Hibiscus syriacus]
MRNFPEIKDIHDEREFTHMIKAIKVRHNNVVPTMALGGQQLKKGMDPKIVYEDLDEIHQFLDRFYMSRIGIRMLIALSACLNLGETRGSMSSCISRILRMLLAIYIQKCLRWKWHEMLAKVLALFACVNTGLHPKLLSMAIPVLHFRKLILYTAFSQVVLMVFELVKNSLRAVQERFMDLDKVTTPVRIIVAEGIEDVTIKISDEGGGIPRKGLPKIFTYLYSTAKTPLDEYSALVTDDEVTMNL